MKLRYKQTGEILDVPEAFARANPELYESLDSKQSVSQRQAPQNIMTQAGEFGKNALLVLLSPFVNTGRNIGGALIERGRSSAMDQLSTMGRSTSDEMSRITDLLLKEKDPKKKDELLARSRLLGQALGQQTQVSDRLVQTENPLLSRGDISRLTTIPGATEEIARNTAGLASFAIDPARGGLLPQILRSAAQGGLMTASQKGTGATEIAGGAILSGALGGALGVGSRLFGGRSSQALGSGEKELISNLQKIAKETRNKNIGQKITGIGRDLRESVFQPSTSGGAFHAFEKGEKQALQEVLALEGNASAQLEQIGNQARFIQGRIKERLPTIKTQVTKKSVNDLFKEELKRQITEPDAKKVKSAVSMVSKQMEEIMAGGSTTAQKLYALKSTYGDDLMRAFKKEPVGGQLTAVEEVKRAAFNALKKAIDTVDNKEISAYNGLENKIFEIANDLIKTEKRSAFGGDFITSLLRSKPAQSASDFLGRGAIKTGSAIDSVLRSPLGEAAKTGINVAERIPGQLSNLLFRGQQEVGATGEVSGEELPVGDITTQVGTDSEKDTQIKKLLQSAMIYDLAKNQGKQATEIKAAMDIFDLQGGGKKTDAQQAASDVKEMIKEASLQLPKIKRKVGIFGIGTKTQNFLANIDMADQDVLSFATTIANVKAMIAKTRAGTAFTPNEEKLLDRYTPNENDSYQSLQIKLKWLEKQFANK